jgi:dipeptidyl-peptidase-4
VYEEEFSLAKAFFWSPDNNKIAFLKFDEQKVKEFTMTRYTGDLYPVYEKFKYPKVGEDNSEVSVYIFNLKTGKTNEVDLSEKPNYYLPRIKWDRKGKILTITALNRHQNHLRLYGYSPEKDKTKVLIEETSPYYIDIHDNLTFLPKNDQFIWSSDRSGWHHLYLFDIPSMKMNAITTGDYEVTNLYGYDQKSKKIYFQAAKQGPEFRQLCSIDIKGKDLQIISNLDGWNKAQFSNTFDYYILNHSTINSPPTYQVLSRENKEVRIIENNDQIKTLQRATQVQQMEFFEFINSSSSYLNGWMLKPPDFDSTKQYPLFMYVYGGPGSQLVTDSWKGNNYWWFQMLAKEGYVVVCIDNRGTGGRGEEFRKMTYLQLGKYETLDQIDGAMYLGRKSYIDAKRIGIFGWSYGGFMSTNALLKGNDIFAAAIAVAPVTNWKWYDTVYTERYMRTVAENKEGYRLNSPVNYADKLKGNFLLVHGIADNNVHFQHSAEMMNALIKANKQFDTYAYPNRNHGIYGDNARLHLYSKMTEFIKKNI